tara:strand:- start:1459 stop:11292 length:9834 start_codon:yes stop_codon:yes gene_type:complete
MALEIEQDQDQVQPERKIPTPDEVFGTKKRIPTPDEVLGVKKKSSLGYSVTPLPSQDKFDIGEEVATIGYKSPIGKAIQKDKIKGSNLAGIYNEALVGSLSSIIGGGVYMADILAAQPYMPLNVRVANAQADRKKITDIIENARIEKGFPLITPMGVDWISSSKEFEQQQGAVDVTPKEGGGLFSGLDWEDARGVLFQAPKTVLQAAAGGASGGSTFVLQSINDNAKELEESGVSDKLSDTQKVGYLFVQATIMAGLNKFSIDKILKNTGLAKNIQNKIAKEVIEEQVKKGVKATAKDIEREVFKKVSTLSTKFKSAGIKGAEAAVTEGTTEGLEQAGSDAVKLITNKIAKNEVFNEEDINKNFWKNVVNNVVVGGAMGGVMGGGLQGLNSTDKAIRQQVANATGEKKFYVDDKEVTENEFNQSTGNKKVTTDLQNIQDQINKQVEEGNLTPEEAEAASITAQQYAEIAGKIPTTVSKEDKYKIIGGISQRNSLQQDLQNAREEMMQVDPIFRKEKQDQVDLIQAKIDETGDYLEGLATGKKPRYIKRDGRKGEETTYYKVDENGDSTPISQARYDLAKAIKKEDSRKKAPVDENRRRRVEQFDILYSVKSNNPEFDFPNSFEEFNKKIDSDPNYLSDLYKRAKKYKETGEIAEDEMGTEASFIEAINPPVEKDITIGEVVDKKGTYKNEKGTFLQEGDNIVFKNEASGEKYEVGKAAEIQEKPASEFDIKYDESLVAVDDKGNISVREKPYINRYSNPLKAINKDEDGNIVSVNLETADGKKRTFKGSIAEDIAYQINLKEKSKEAPKVELKAEQVVEKPVQVVKPVKPVVKVKEEIEEEVEPIKVKEKPKTKVEEIKTKIKSKLESFKERFAPVKKTSTQGEKIAEAKDVYKKLKEMDAATDAEQVGLRYLADGGTVSQAAINEVAGSTATARATLNTGRKVKTKSEEAKARDYVAGDESLDDLAHRLWEANKQRIPEDKIKEALMEEIGNNNTKFDAAKAYLERYSPEYTQQSYEDRMSEQMQAEEEEFRRKLEEEGLEEAPFAVREATTEDVEAMQEIVADYVKDGVTALDDIKREIAKELGYNTKALRQIVEDAYLRYTKTTEVAPAEIINELLRRIGNKMKQMFGKNAKKPYIAQDSKDIKLKFNDISETGGSVAFQVTLPNGEKVVAKPIDANVVNGFYSPLELQINQMKADKMPAKQWLEKLRSEEAKWSGLSDWLSQQKESVSKDQIRNYLNTNKVEIFEIVKGVPNKLNEEQIQRLNYLIKLDKENPGGAIEDIEEGKFKDNSYDELMFLLNVRDNSTFEELSNLQLETEQKARVAQQVGLKDKADKLWDDAHRYTKRIEILELSPEGEGGIENPTRHSQYQLPGDKKDYKEYLITQPRKNILTEKDDVFYEAKNKERELSDIEDELNKKYVDNYRKKEKLKVKRDNLKDIDELADITNEINKLDIELIEQDDLLFKHKLKINANDKVIQKYQDKLENVKFIHRNHFDEANVLVHVRTNIRKDSDGKNVLFAEEIQSDWGQEGKKHGFKYEALTDAEKNRYDELRNIISEKTNQYKNLNTAFLFTQGEKNVSIWKYENDEDYLNFLKSRNFERIKLIDEALKRRNDLKDKILDNFLKTEKNDEIKNDIIKEIERQKSEDYKEYLDVSLYSTVAPFDYELYKKETEEKSDLYDKQSKGEKGENPAPFVTKTNDWVKLGLKTLLKEAVKSGVDRLAWTNGEQQNNRWSLAKYVDNIQVFKRDNKFYVIGFQNGNEIIDKELTRDKLAENIGKELSEKVINDFSDEKVTDKNYEGEDLEMGGNGMRAFYGVPFESKLGIVGEVAKSLFKQTPQKLELIGVSDIKKFKEKLQNKKDELFLIKKDLEILNKKPEYISELNVLKNKLREEYYQNEDEYSRLNQKRYRIDEERDKINAYLYGNTLDERTKEINKEIYKLEQFEPKNNREYAQWNKELDDLANEKKNIIKEYEEKLKSNEIEYKEIRKEMQAISDKNFALNQESNAIGDKLDKIKNAPKFEKNILKNIKRLEDDIAKGNPTQWYVDITPELKQQVQQGLPLFMANPDGTDVLGFSYDNKMYLNGEKLNPNTPIHEAGHIWTDWIKDNDSKLYDKGMELVEKSPYLQKAKNSKFYQEQADKLATEEQREAYFKHEALAMAIGDKGAQFVLESKKESFQDWLKTLWTKIKNLTGFKDLTAEEFQNLTFDQFSKMAVKEILGTEGAVDKLNAIKSFRNKKKFIKDNLKYESNKNAIDELDFTEEDFIEIAKSNFDLSTFKNIKDAVQKRSTKKVLQPKQGEDGETRSGRRRVEPRVEGERITDEEGETTQPEGITQIPEEIQNVGLENQDIDYVRITKAELGKLRESLGLPAYKGLPIENREMLREAAQEMIKKGVSVESLYDKIRRGDVLSNYENAFMAEYRAALDVELKNNPSQELLKKIAEFADIFQQGASLAGKALESLKIMKKLNEANTLSNFLLTRQEDKGFPLTPKMMVEETAKFEKVQKAKKELKESAENDIENQIKTEAENELKKEGKAKVKKSHEEFVKERKDALAAAREAVKKVNKGDGGLMVSAPYLPQLIAVAPHMNKYVKSLFAEGVSKLDDIVTEVHKEFSELVEGLTKRDVLDVIAGKHNLKKRTSDEINAGLRLLRREAELLALLEKARLGEEEAKSESQMAEKSRRIEQLEKKIKEVRELNKAKELAEEGVVEKSPSIDKKDLTDAEYNQRRQRFIDKKIKKLQSDLDNKNFDKEAKELPKYKISNKTKKMMDKVIELEKAIAIERYKDQASKLSKWEKAWDKYRNIAGIRRIVQTSIDASIWFRQLARLTMNPRQWSIARKFLTAGVQSVFSQKNFDRLMYGIHQAPDFKESVDDGIRYNELGTAKEHDMYPKSFLFEIPVLREPILASQRIADASLNVARYELYNKYKRNLLSKGITRESDPIVYQEMAKWVMNTTGSGNMLKTLETREGEKIMGSLFYGARLMAANFNTLNLAYYYKMPSELKQAIWKDVASYTSVVLSATLAAVAAGGAVSMDPDEPDFLQVRFGSKVYDFTAGQAGYIKTFLRLLEMGGTAIGAVAGFKSKFEAKEKASFAWNSTLTFFRNKLSPNNAYLINMMAQENSIGQDFDPMEIFHVYPMYADDAYKAAKEDGFISLLTVLMPNMIGMGYGDYYKERALKPMDEIIIQAQDSDEMNPESVKKGITKKEFEKFVNLRDKLIEEKITELYSKGIYVVKDGIERYVPIKESNSKDVSAAISKAKTAATKKAKSQFNATDNDEE